MVKECAVEQTTTDTKREFSCECGSSKFLLVEAAGEICGFCSECVACGRQYITTPFGFYPKDKLHASEPSASDTSKEGFTVGDAYMLGVNSVLPLYVEAVDGRIVEVVTCDSISGGADYDPTTNMPRRLSISVNTPEGRRTANYIIELEIEKDYGLA